MSHVYLAKNAPNPGFSKESHEKQDRKKERKSEAEIVAVGGIRHRKRKMKSPYKFPAAHSAPQSLVENVQKKHRAGKKKRCCSLCFPNKEKKHFFSAIPACGVVFLKTALGHERKAHSGL